MSELGPLTSQEVATIKRDLDVQVRAAIMQGHLRADIPVAIKLNVLRRLVVTAQCAVEQNRMVDVRAAWTDFFESMPVRARVQMPPELARLAVAILGERPDAAEGQNHPDEKGPDLPVANAAGG